MTMILYVCDGEGPAVMELDRLLSNFTDSEAWTNMPTTEPDIRYDVIERGWSMSHHDNGHFMILNLDDKWINTLVTLTPEAWDKWTANRHVSGDHGTSTVEPVLYGKGAL